MLVALFTRSPTLQVPPPRKRSKAQPAQPPDSMAAAAAELDSLRDSHPWLDGGGSGIGSGGSGSGSGSGVGGQRARAAAENYGTGAAASGAWDVLDGAMGSQGDMPASQDENVARLMEMGYGADQASKVGTLRFPAGCSVVWLLFREAHTHMCFNLLLKVDVLQALWMSDSCMKAALLDITRRSLSSAICSAPSVAPVRLIV